MTLIMTRQCHMMYVKKTVVAWLSNLDLVWIKMIITWYSHLIVFYTLN